MTIQEVATEARKKGLKIDSVAYGDLTWYNIEKPTERETEYLAEHFPFHPLDLDDCLSRIQRPKMDEYRDYLFVVLHFPVFNKETRATTPSQVSVFVGEDYLITLHKGELKPMMKLFRECQLEEEARQENFSQGSGYLLYRIVDRLIDYCFPILNRIHENIEQTEDNIFASTRVPRAIEAISVLRRDVIAFRRIIWPMRAVIASLEPRIRRFTKMDLNVYFGDTVDHLDKIWDALDEYKEIIEGLNDTHDSLATNRTNEAMRVLTLMGTIMLPLLVVSGLWSMNIPLPFGADPGGDHRFFGIMIGVLLMMVAVMLFYFRRKRWI